MMNKYNSQGILKGQGEQVYLYRKHVFIKLHIA